MEVTPYNLHETIGMLRGRALLLLMSDEVNSLQGRYAKALFDLVGDMTEGEALEAISDWEKTQ